MKIYKYTIFTIMLFLICITNTYAACTKKERNEFKKIEDEYTVKYEFNKSSKKYDMYFTSTKTDKYDYQIYSDTKLDCTSINDTTIKCINLPPDEYDIEIIGVTDTCDDILKTITLNLAKYNKYSEDPLCEGIEEFVLCKPTYDKEIDYETFVSRVNTYKNTKEKQEIPTEIEDEENNQVSSEILDYIKENLISIIIIIVFIVLVIITIVITAKSIRKSRRLE